MTVQVNVYEAKTNLSKLLERVQAGERVVISKAGTPIAEIIPHKGQHVRRGSLRGEVKYDDATFDDPDPDILAMFYGDDAAS